MGQYHLIVNLTKREFIDPHQLGIGLKAFEQLASFPSTPQALFIVLVCSNGRGGGDLASSSGIIGRWAGDRIAIVGDYAEDTDIAAPLPDAASRIYDLCFEGIYTDITALTRPVIAAELGIEYLSRPHFLRKADGDSESWERWEFRRDPNAAFSVLDDVAPKGPAQSPDLTVTIENSD